MNVQREQSAVFKEALIDKLTHEVAVLKRLKFAATCYTKSRSVHHELPAKIDGFFNQYCEHFAWNASVDSEHSKLVRLSVQTTGTGR